MVQYFIFFIIRCTIYYSNHSDQFSSFLYVDNWQRYCSYLYLFTMNLFVLQHFLGHLGNPTTVISESFEKIFMHKKIKYNNIIMIKSYWCFYTNIYKEKNVCTKCQFTQECVLFFSFITGERDTESVLLLFFV